MSHLPVRDVHLLVVARRERKHHHISSSVDPISTCLHHLRETVWRSKLTSWDNAYSRRLKAFYAIPCWRWWSPWSPCGCRPVSGSRLQEYFLRHTREHRLNMQLLSHIKREFWHLFYHWVNNDNRIKKGHIPSSLTSPAPMTHTSARRTLPLFRATSFSCVHRNNKMSRPCTVYA